jgi:hypothetical protein
MYHIIYIWLMLTDNFFIYIFLNVNFEAFVLFFLYSLFLQKGMYILLYIYTELYNIQV